MRYFVLEILFYSFYDQFLAAMSRFMSYVTHIYSFISLLLRKLVKRNKEFVLLQLCF